MANLISIKKIRTIIEQCNSDEAMNIRALARSLRISRNTLKRYTRKIKTLPDDALNNSKEALQILRANQKENHRKKELIEQMPIIHERIKSENSNLRTEWNIYLNNNVNGYRFTHFAVQYSDWCRANSIIKATKRKWLNRVMTENELLELSKWKNSSDRRKWEKAIVLFEAQKGKPIVEIANKIDRSYDKVKEWIHLFNKEGLVGLQKKKRKINPSIAENVKRKKENVIKLIHETPKLHNINRASWDLKSIVKAYRKLYSESISKTTISSYLKDQGFTFRKAKETLTSPDPDFREKLDKIKNILENLKEDEKFFSVDEFGPFSVKIKGGRSIVKKGERKTYPQRQKSKGFLICTAALELSKNRVTHFYSLKKNTDEMIKLLELLLRNYPNEKRIFFSWDAASWHASKKLYNKLDEVNSDAYRQTHNNPIVELAPLPASAQFLNVIESVFSGMAKAIIHNSNYQSVDECKAAIDLYFHERNQFFKENPKKAGNKIWGKELVKPVFSESNNCKDPRWR